MVATDCQPHRFRATAIWHPVPLAGEAQERRAVSSPSLLTRMQQEPAELNARETERGVVLTMPDVRFDTARATLKPGAALALDGVASVLNERPAMRVLVEGHTDSRGSDAYRQ